MRPPAGAIPEALEEGILDGLRLALNRRLAEAWSGRILLRLGPSRHHEILHATDPHLADLVLAVLDEALREARFANPGDRTDLFLLDLDGGDVALLHQGYFNGPRREPREHLHLP